MATDRSEYQIRITTTSDASGIEKIKQNLKEAGQAGAESGNVIVTSQREVAEAIQEGGKAAEEAGGGVEVLKQSLKLLKMATGDALGPVEELGEFLTNPYTLAIAGATLTVKMLIEQHQQSLNDSRVQASVLAGQTNGPEAHAQTEANRKRARQQEEDAADHRFQAEQELRRTTANAEEQKSKETAGRAEQARQEQIRLETFSKFAQDELKHRQDTQTQLQEQANEANAKAAASTGMRSLFTEEQARNILAFGGSGSKFLPGINAWRKKWEADQANTTLETHKNAVVAQEETVSRASQQLKDQQAAAAHAEAESIKAKQEADDLRQEMLDDQATADRERRDPIEDETVRQNRRNYLQQQDNAGKLTPAEAEVYTGAFSNRPGQDFAALQTKFRGIETSVRASGGSVTAEQMDQLHAITDRILGLLENEWGANQHREHQANNLERRVEALESNQRSP